jgi:hypothetical protein
MLLRILVIFLTSAQKYILFNHFKNLYHLKIIICVRSEYFYLKL